MTHFGELLKEARIRARLTQQELAKRVPIHHSYISKMENEDFLPSREKAIKLAETLGISDDEEKYLEFLNAAEDLKGFKLVKVEDSEAEPEEEEQASGVATHSAGSPAISVRSLPSSTTGGKIDRLIASGRFSEEQEEEVEAALIEIVKRFIAIKETQRKMREEG